VRARSNSREPSKPGPKHKKIPVRTRLSCKIEYLLSQIVRQSIASEFIAATPDAPHPARAKQRSPGRARNKLQSVRSLHVQQIVPSCQGASEVRCY